jgi:hypothetical protein
MKHLMWVAAGLFVMTACSEEDPCADYVNYMCDCHADDEDFDCEELQTTYENADAGVQDECAIALDEQEEADLEAGLECGV